MRRFKINVLGWVFMVSVVSVITGVAGVAGVGCTEHPMTNATPDPFMSSSIGAPAPGGGLGATAGGVQDMQLARQLVEEGRVPPPEAFSVEGMFSEHDLPLDGAPCQNTLCLRAAMGIAPDGHGAAAAWVQVGFSSNVDPDTFDRPSLTLVVAVDVSGSMGASYTGGTSPLDLSKALLSDIVSELEPSDHLAIVTYGSTVHTPVPLGPVVSPLALESSIAALNPSGSTDMEAGLEQAFAIAADAVGQTDEVRVVLFSDERPNIGAIDPTSFQRMVSTAADSGVGLTLLGTGLGLDPELMTAIAGMRGGNAFTVMDEADVDRIMTDHWPWMFCPIAYDLSVRAAPNGLSLVDAYGFPPAPEGETEAELNVKTVFLSRNKGGILLQLAPNPTQGPFDGTSVGLKLDYQRPDGTSRNVARRVSYDGQTPDANGQYLPQVGLTRAVALAVLVSSLQQAAELYADEPTAAVEIARDALTRITSDAAALGDTSLDPEVAFTAALLGLMEADAPQDPFYMGY